MRYCFPEIHHILILGNYFTIQKAQMGSGLAKPCFLLVRLCVCTRSSVVHVVSYLSQIYQVIVPVGS